MTQRQKRLQRFWAAPYRGNHDSLAQKPGLPPIRVCRDCQELTSAPAHP